MKEINLSRLILLFFALLVYFCFQFINSKAEKETKPIAVLAETPFQIEMFPSNGEDFKRIAGLVFNEGVDMFDKRGRMLGRRMIELSDSEGLIHSLLVKTDTSIVSEIQVLFWDQYKGVHFLYFITPEEVYGQQIFKSTEPEDIWHYKPQIKAAMYEFIARAMDCKII